MLVPKETSKQLLQHGLVDTVQIRIANVVKEIDRDEEPMHKQAYVSIEKDEIIIE